MRPFSQCLSPKASSAPVATAPIPKAGGAAPTAVTTRCARSRTRSRAVSCRRRCRTLNRGRADNGRSKGVPPRRNSGRRARSEGDSRRKRGTIATAIAVVSGRSNARRAGLRLRSRKTRMRVPRFSRPRADVVVAGAVVAEGAQRARRMLRSRNSNVRHLRRARRSRRQTLSRAARAETAGASDGASAGVAAAETAAEEILRRHPSSPEARSLACLPRPRLQAAQRAAASSSGIAPSTPRIRRSECSNRPCGPACNPAADRRSRRVRCRARAA